MKRIQTVIMALFIVMCVAVVVMVRSGPRLPMNPSSQDLSALLPTLIPTDVFAGLYCEDYDDKYTIIEVFVTNITGLPYQNQTNLRYHKVKYSLKELEDFQSRILSCNDKSVIGVYPDIAKNKLVISVYPRREDISQVIEQYIPADAYSIEFMDSPFVLF